MMLTTTLDGRSIPLSAAQEADIHRVLTELGRRLEHHPEPIAILVFAHADGHGEVVASLRVRLGPPEMVLTSRQSAATANEAALLAAQAIHPQFERLLAGPHEERHDGVRGDNVLNRPPPAVAA